MKTTLQLEPAIYFAGIDRPWYASKGAVRDELGKRYGFINVRIYPRTMALPVNPRVDPRYSEELDEWLRAEFTGAPVKKETERLWAWLVKVPRAEAQKNAALRAPAPEPPDERSGAAVALVGVPVAAALMLWRRGSRR